MNYSAELKKFVTSQYIYSGVRIALAIVVPSIILAYFGLLKEYFLFPLGTSFVGFTDQPGPFIRRRNSLLLAVGCFFFVAAVASLVKDYQALVFLEIIIFGMFFSMIGVYGLRLAAVGSLALVVLGIFIDGHLTGEHIFKSLMIFLAGCFWFFVIFLIVSKIQPYKLAGQMIGESYTDLADYLRIKAKYYGQKPNFETLVQQSISQQIKIKNLQEEIRETVFKTRTIVNESTTQSRLLMMMFLNSIDLHELLMTSETDYRKIYTKFSGSGFLEKISSYLLLLADEMTEIGIAMQGGFKIKPKINLSREISSLYDEYFNLRNRALNPETLEDFMILRQIMKRISEITEGIQDIFTVFSQNEKFAKSLSTGLDFNKFVPSEEKLNRKVFLNNFALGSSHFRHSVRITVALLAGYLVSKLKFLGIGHSYWILITILAIMRPAYSTTKHRNLLRLYGTVSGAVAAYAILFFVKDGTTLLVILLSSMVLCFSLLKAKYHWATFFMTIYIFLAFNFLNPGSVNTIFKDRIIDTVIAGAVAFLASYFVLPVWEHTQNRTFMMNSAKANFKYFGNVINYFFGMPEDEEKFRISRKHAIVSLANLSDNFQRMISDPKNQQKKMEVVHQFVTTSHLITAYTASLSQFTKNGERFPEIDFPLWKQKILAELNRTQGILGVETEKLDEQTPPEPENIVEELLFIRKKEIHENDFLDLRDPSKITHLTNLKSIQELLQLIFDAAKEQRKVVESYYRTTAPA